MSLNFKQIGPLTRELPALEKTMYNVVNTLAPLFLIVSTSFLQVTRTTIKSLMSLNFGQIQPWTVELATLDRLKNILLEHYFDDLLASGERSLPFGLLVLST